MTMSLPFSFRRFFSMEKFHGFIKMELRKENDLKQSLISFFHSESSIRRITRPCREINDRYHCIHVILHSDMMTF